MLPMTRRQSTSYVFVMAQLITTEPLNGRWDASVAVEPLEHRDRFNLDEPVGMSEGADLDQRRERVAGESRGRDHGAG